MFEKKHTTLYWIWFLGTLTAIFIMTNTDWGLVIGGITLLLVAGVTFWAIGKWIYRKVKLIVPCEVHLWIPDKQHTVLPYVQQDDDEHKTNCLILPPNSEMPILLWVKYNITFEEKSMYFGFEGNLNEKPEPIKYYNPFIDKGNREIMPGGSSQEEHYIDFYKSYHIEQKKTETPKEAKVSGFMVQTHARGDYEARGAF